MKLETHMAGAAGVAAKADPAKTAAKQLEAFFLRQMLAEAKPAGAEGVDGGFAGDTFKQMFNEAVADKMSDSGGIGMAEIMAKQLSRGSGADNADAMTAMKISGANLHRGTAVDTVAAAPGGPALKGALPDGYAGPALQMPVIGRASSGYGVRMDPIQHKEIKHPGFDLAAPTGTVVGAAAAGTITHAGPAGTYGNLVTVTHAAGYETRYAHLSAVSVKVGDHVDAGAPIGNVGTTGASTGPHLHFEVRHDGAAIDPAPLLPLNKSESRTNR